jgi:hypothetical protein
MKKLSLLFLAVFVFSMTALFQSCGSSKKVITPKTEGEVLVEVYCSGPEYQSNKDYIRYNALAQSMDQMTSKKKALSEARAGLAGQVSLLVKGVIDNYVKSSEAQVAEDLLRRYEGLTREVIDQKLNGTRTICEKMTKTKEGNYKTYVCIELSGADLLASMNNKLSNEQQLKIDYNYEKFKKTFEDEMNKVGSK